MACACRSSTWAGFIRGIAQLHRGDATVAAAKLPPALWAAERRVYARQPGRLRRLGVQTRTISSSLARRVEAAASVEATNDSSEVREEMKHPQRPPPEALEAKAANPVDIKAKKPKNPRIARSQPHSPVAPQPEPKAKAKDKALPKPSEPPETTQKLEDWQIQKDALGHKFPLGWMPRKRLSPDALAGIRALHAQFPNIYTTPALANKFEVSPEAIRRILKSRWTPSPEEEDERRERWHRRGISIWERKTAMGFKPSRKWKAEGIRRGAQYYRWKEGVKRKVEGVENEVKERRERMRAERVGRNRQIEESRETSQTGQTGESVESGKSGDAARGNGDKQLTKP